MRRGPSPRQVALQVILGVSFTTPCRTTVYSKVVQLGSALARLEVSDAP